VSFEVVGIIETRIRIWMPFGVEQQYVDAMTGWDKNFEVVGTRWHTSQLEEMNKEAWNICLVRLIGEVSFVCEEPRS
jgi:hypothetical protein